MYVCVRIRSMCHWTPSCAAHVHAIFASSTLYDNAVHVLHMLHTYMYVARMQHVTCTPSTRAALYMHMCSTCVTLIQFP